MSGISKLYHRSKRRVKKLLGMPTGNASYTPYRTTEDQWNREYAGTRWDYMAEIHELGRYSITAGYCHFLAPVERVLDVGCGPGILLRSLKRDAFSEYVGIDYSAESIWQAQEEWQAPGITFEKNSAETYAPSRPFDIVIFNECLYYIGDPVQLVKQYLDYLKEKGAIVISMYYSDASDKIWKLLDQDFSFDDAVQVTHQSGAGWTVKLLYKRTQK